jgi:protein translocase SecG subunit
LVYLLYALFILSCLTLIASVLLQPGKSDAGALFTSSVSSTAFGPRGTLNILSKITIVAATVFMLSAFLLSQQALTGGRSVLESGGIPAESPATTGGADSNANSAVATENAMGSNTQTNAATDANIAVTNANITASNANVGSANTAASPASNTATTNTANTQ